MHCSGSTQRLGKNGRYYIFLSPQCPYDLSGIPFVLKMKLPCGCAMMILFLFCFCSGPAQRL